MRSQQLIPFPVRIKETIADEVQQMYDEITRRAYEVFQQRGGNSTLDLEDWLTAERELLHKPDVRIEEANRQIVVTVYLGEMSPLQVELLVTPDAMLIQGSYASGPKKVFRAVQFPRRVDAGKAEAHYCDGCLVLTA